MEANQDRRRGTSPSAEAQAAKRARPSRHIVLNIGGEKFETTLDTLSNFSDSYFSALASGRHRLEHDEDGSIFIDRSPKQFYHILQYLRNGIRGLCLPESEEERDELLLEAQFYSLPRLEVQLRRFKLWEYLNVKFEKGADRAGYLEGLPRGFALFDVQNQEEFEITFRGVSRESNTGDDWSDLYLGTPNMIGVFIGIVPKDVDLDAPWEVQARPLPGPHVPPAGIWPPSTLMPPAMRHGLFCTLTVCLFRAARAEYDADAHLVQFVARGDFNASNNDRKSLWTRRQVCIVAMRFVRDANSCTLEFKLQDDDPIFPIQSHRLDLAQEGLDTSLPYRPVIFFGKRAHASFDDYLNFSRVSR